MPVIVDEVVISVEVANADPGASGASGNATAGAPGQGAAQGQQVIVAECVERVLEILRERGER